jgi:hypothetical protein
MSKKFAKTKELSCRDVINAGKATKNNVLIFGEYKDYPGKSEGKKKSYPVTYMYPQFVTADGNCHPKWTVSAFVPTYGRAKFYQDESSGRVPKYGTISFTDYKVEEILGGDYVNKVDKNADPSGWMVAEKNLNKRCEAITGNNVLFMQAQRVLHESYLNFIKKLRLAKKKGEIKFSIMKQQSVLKINPIVMTEIMDPLTDTITKLDKPCVRIRYPIPDFANDKHVGLQKYDKETKIWSYKEPQFFDLVKCKRKGVLGNRAAEIPCTVEEDGVVDTLRYDTIGRFVTKKSLLKFKFTLDSITSAVSGISAALKFVDRVYVKHHKSSTNIGMSEADQLEINSSCILDDLDSDDEADVKVSAQDDTVHTASNSEFKSKNNSKSNANPDTALENDIDFDEDDDMPEGLDDDEDDEDDEPTAAELAEAKAAAAKAEAKKKLARRKAAKAKAAKAAKAKAAAEAAAAEDDDEDEDDDLSDDFGDLSD